MDTAHQNLVIPDAIEFSPFFELLRNRGYDLHIGLPNTPICDLDLGSYRTFLLGVPQNRFILQDEIQSLLEFVRDGGSLLIFNRYGGDVVQKSNLGELTKNFGIYCENTLIRQPERGVYESIPIFSNLGNQNIIPKVKKIIIPGCCSLRLAQDAQSICSIGSFSAIDVFNPHTFDWLEGDVLENSPELCIAGYAIYGQGRVVVIGSPDFLQDDPHYGLSSLDNRAFISQILEWLMQPVSDLEVRDWMLQQIGILSNSLFSVQNILEKKIIPSMDQMNTRMRSLEYKIYELKGVHLPVETLTSTFSNDPDPSVIINDESEKDLDIMEDPFIFLEPPQSFRDDFNLNQENEQNEKKPKSNPES